MKYKLFNKKVIRFYDMSKDYNNNANAIKGWEKEISENYVYEYNNDEGEWIKMLEICKDGGLLYYFVKNHQWQSTICFNSDFDIILNEDGI